MQTFALPAATQRILAPEKNLSVGTRTAHPLTRRPRPRYRHYLRDRDRCGCWPNRNRWGRGSPPGPGCCRTGRSGSRAAARARRSARKKGRGRIIGDYRRVALYGVDRLVVAKRAELATLDNRLSSDAIIRDREELNEQIRALAPDAILISPGPGDPDQSGVCLEVLRELSPTIPTLGVCLGHQSIAQVYGGRVVRARELMHGKTSPVHHAGQGVFAGLPNPLSVTGFDLEPPDMARFLGGFETAGYIHRTAAVVMFGVFFTHLGDLVRRWRRDASSLRTLLLGPDTMLFTMRDLSEFWGSLRWFVGAGPRPAFGRWTYWEKFDYFAVFWGIFIIGFTGLTLWFPIFFTRFFPGSFLNVATIVHSDEALLATGFIFTVHFFNTHLRPEKFPMDIVIFTGRMSMEDFKRDKPSEYAKLVESGELEKYLVEPYPPVVIRAIRVFGFVAVSMGFAMVVGIIYAMVFAYR